MVVQMLGTEPRSLEFLVSTNNFILIELVLDENHREHLFE